MRDEARVFAARGVLADGETYNLTTVPPPLDRLLRRATHTRDRMKFSPERIDAQSISGYGPGWVAVAGEKIESSVILGAKGLREAWDVQSFEQLGPEHFAHLATLDAEVMLLGTGEHTRFVPPKWLAPLFSRRIGLETMDRFAACRTYNILAAEGRNVVVALIISPPPPA